MFFTINLLIILCKKWKTFMLNEKVKQVLIIINANFGSIIIKIVYSEYYVTI